MSLRENQAAAKQPFGFLGSLTSKCPAFSRTISAIARSSVPDALRRRYFVFLRLLTNEQPCEAGQKSAAARVREFISLYFSEMRIPMNQKVLKTLEYDKIIELLSQKADSEPGKKLCRELVPSTDLSEIRKNQAETGDALNRLFQSGSTSFGSNKDLGFSIKSL